MKKTALLCILTILCISLFNACKRDSSGEATPTGTGTVEQKDSVGLAFVLTPGGGTYHPSGIGSCKDKNIRVPETYNSKPVTAVKEEAFKNSDITSITLPKSIITVGASAFAGCHSLKRAVMYGGVNNIEEGAFSECIALDYIYLPSSLWKIDEYAFFSCTSLREIYIPDSVKEIHDSTFEGCVFDKIEVSKDNKYFSSPSGCLTDKAAERLYKGTSSSTIPETVKTIGKNAFSGCTGITEITIPKSVRTIEDGAFSGCSGLIKVNVSEGVTTIGELVFSGCSSLKEINLPSTLTGIGTTGLSGLPSLERITVADGNEIFSSDGNCFTMKKNGSYTLIRGFSTSVIPTYVNIIGNNAFQNCSITSVTIPAELTKIDSYAFSGCDSLTSVSFEDGSRELAIGYAAFSGTSITSVTFPKRLSSISSEAFKGCALLSSAIFHPDSSLLFIERRVFSGTQIESLILPKNVMSFYEDAFSGCTKLKEISLSHSPSQFGVYLFDECTSLETVYFSGTRSQWEYFEKTDFPQFTYNWNRSCPDVKVICSDGTITYK